MTLSRRVKPHAKIVRNLIVEGIEDAEAHARHAIGVAPANGVGFVGLTAGGPLGAANKRLDNLGAAIVATVQRARVEFYANSHEIQRPYLRRDVHRLDLHPTREGAIACRDALIHGRSLQGDMTHAVENVKFTLRGAISQGTDAALRGWRKATMDRLQAAAETWLMDSSRAINSAVAWATIKPELRPKLR